MQRVVIGAPTNLGLKPYDDGRPRAVDRGPAVYRELRLPGVIGARDAGDVPAAPYRDLVCTPGGARNEDLVEEHAMHLAAAVRRVTEEDAFPVVLGGDCSILLGSLLGLRSRGDVGLVFMDAHRDFATAEISPTGGIAGMDLALAVGRGDSPLARLAGPDPLVREDDVVLLGRKDEGDEDAYGDHSTRFTSILDLPHARLSELGAARAIEMTMARVARTELSGFFVHLDVDVLRPDLMPAVDSPEPGGMDEQELETLLALLVQHPRALGLQVVIYDPSLDPHRTAGRRLVDLLGRAFAGAP